jgi:hypothetical protein
MASSEITDEVGLASIPQKKILPSRRRVCVQLVFSVLFLDELFFFNIAKTVFFAAMEQIGSVSRCGRQ